ncbi:hypothetical protein [Burkholderia metallica]|uniref:hypothetical protein n=1 Tax=Burkholderia metallica TaxID=488729 RepID=UPI001CF45831|nr:hypothetical protein [Burkholderia metallica]MCA8023441.1 hypothetical protein [Burkholderia metallica]
MSSNISANCAVTDAVRTDDVSGSNGAPRDVVRNEAQFVGNVVLSLLALISGGGAALKDAANGALSPPTERGTRGDRSGPPSANHATLTGVIPVTTERMLVGDGSLLGIAPGEGDDTEQGQALDLVDAEGLLSFVFMSGSSVLGSCGEGNLSLSVADVLPTSRTAGSYDVGLYVDGEAGETIHVTAGSVASVGTAELRTIIGDRELPNVEFRVATPFQMLAARRGEAASPARFDHAVIADATATLAGLYATEMVCRASTLAAATGYSLSAQGAVHSGIYVLKASFIEPGWIARHARSPKSATPSDSDVGLGLGADTDVGDPSSVASGNEAAGVVSVVRFAVQLREWLDERRPCTLMRRCTHRRTLHCLWYCRSRCARLGA